MVWHWKKIIHGEIKLTTKDEQTLPSYKYIFHFDKKKIYPVDLKSDICLHHTSQITE